jgi:cytochrome c-type biogenesis protein CcmF
MSAVEYIGEWRWAAQLGHGLIVLGFVSALLALWGYFQAERLRGDTPASPTWLLLGRWSFLVHGVSVLSVIGLIFYLMLNHRYEFQYVQQHVSDDLDFKYIFSAFWEGQEGSFLLWMFWHVVLAWVFIRGKLQWEAPVMAVVAGIELVLLSMLLGHYWGIGTWSFKVGSSPFMLLREVVQAPIFSQPDYVSKLKGNGLNPLLQNYWMTIHPPTLFLGFASTLMPFAYAIAGLWRREHTAWLKPALVWSLFSGAILGLGILMGGAWAYEALSFGGYWAWDPVENMSLVPWLVLVAGIHTHLIANATGRSIRATYLFYTLSFVGVVYSTFLTRSGVLGDTSVHAFTTMGLGWQLVIFLGLSALLGFGLLAVRNRSIPSFEEEEKLGSREFWMFIGTLVLFFSSVLITFTTSIPVYNKIFDGVGSLIGQDLSHLHRSSPVDAVAHHNRFQLWIAVFIGILTGFAQFLRYREQQFANRRQSFMVQMGIAAAVSLVLSVLTALIVQIPSWQYGLLLATGWFGTVANTMYLFKLGKKQVKLAGASLSHIGFGIMILGIIASGLNKRHISNNLFAQEGLIEGFSPEDYGKNILLMRNAPMIMPGYEVTYKGDTMSGFTRTFRVDYRKLDKNNNPVGEAFSLYPNVLLDKTMTKVAASNPATRRYLTHDVFTHVSSLPRADMDREYAKTLEDSLKYVPYTVRIGDTIFTSRYYGVVESVSTSPVINSYAPEPEDRSVGVKVVFKKLQSDSVWTAEPTAVWRRGEAYYFPATVSGTGLRVRIGEPAIRAAHPLPDDMVRHSVELTMGATAKIAGYTLQLQGLDKAPVDKRYQPQDGDLAIGAKITLTDSSGRGSSATPLFVIRGTQPMSIPAVLQTGEVVILQKLDPEKETFTFDVGLPKGNSTFEIEVAEDAPRNDYIVMEAILFPGINLFWSGSLLMLFGLAMSWWYRRRMRG